MNHTNLHLDIRKKGFRYFQSFIEESIKDITVQESVTENFKAFTKDKEVFSLFCFWITIYIDNRNLILEKLKTFPQGDFKLSFKNQEERIVAEEVINSITENSFFTNELAVKLTTQCSEEKISNVTITNIAVPQ